MNNYLLEINNLNISFTKQAGLLSQNYAEPVKALSLKMKKPEIVAIIGESGSGKSLLASCILDMNPDNAGVNGEILYKNNIMGSKLKQELRGREIKIVPQSLTSLDPLYKIYKQLKNAAKLAGLKGAEIEKAINKALKLYSLEESVLKMYPHQLSGGMAKRILLAMATLSKADLIIADEPTNGLDPKTTADVLNYLKNLNAKGAGVIIITHDLSSVLPIADVVTIFYKGYSVECLKPKNGSLKNAKHPYTQTLWQALPENDFWDKLPKLNNLENTSHLCPFLFECPKFIEKCLHQMPHLKSTGREYVRCHLN